MFPPTEFNRKAPSDMADMMMAIDQGRGRILTISQDAIVGIFNVAFSRPGQLCIPIFKGLPDGYYVNGCYSDPMRRSLSFAVYHPTFNPTSPGMSMPEHNAFHDMKVIPLPPKD